MSETTPAQSFALNLPEDLRRGTKSYDLLAAVPLIVWYALVGVGQARVLTRQFDQLLSERLDIVLAIAILAKIATLLFALIVIALLFVRRPPKAGAQGLLPRAVAVAGTYLGVTIVFMPSRELPSWALAISTLLIVGGMGFALYSVTWLGRSLSMVPEARKLVTGGPYSVVRHPLYLGEQIAIAGAAIQFLSPLTVMIFAIQFGCQLYRMHCEELVLSATFPDYGPYRRRTSRMVPGIY